MPVTTAIGNGELVHHGDLVPLVIDGGEVLSNDSFDVISPGTGEPAHKSSNANVNHALAAIDAGAKSFPEWSQTTPTHRRGIFLKAVDILEKRATELKKYMITETGSDDGWADFNLFLAKECLLGCASRIAGIEGRIPTTQDPSVGALIVKEPYGVVLAVAPW